MVEEIFIANPERYSRKRTRNQEIISFFGPGLQKPSLFETLGMTSRTESKELRWFIACQPPQLETLGCASTAYIPWKGHVYQPLVQMRTKLCQAEGLMYTCLSFLFGGTIFSKIKVLRTLSMGKCSHQLVEYTLDLERFVPPIFGEIGKALPLALPH